VIPTFPHDAETLKKPARDFRKMGGTGRAPTPNRFRWGSAAVINQIRSLTEDTLSECQKRKSALTLKVAALAGAQTDVGALTLTGAGGGSSISLAAAGPGANPPAPHTYRATERGFPRGIVAR
jgi:hypothetical protein